MNKLPQETINKINEFYNQGLNLDEISKKLNVSLSTAYKYVINKKRKKFILFKKQNKEHIKIPIKYLDLIKIDQELKIKKVSKNMMFKGYVTYLNDSFFTIKTEKYPISFMLAEIIDNEIVVSKAK